MTSLLKKAGATKFVVGIFVLALAYFFCRNSGYDGKLWNVFGDYGTGSNDGAFTHFDSGQNDSPGANEDVIPYLHWSINSVEIFGINVVFGVVDHDFGGN